MNISVINRSIDWCVNSLLWGTVSEKPPIWASESMKPQYGPHRVQISPRKASTKTFECNIHLRL